MPQQYRGTSLLTSINYWFAMQKISFKIILLLILPFLAVAQQQKGSSKNSRPNIIFILSDDHAYQAIGAYGNKYAKTPNIDRIAKEGALMVNNLVANSICGPSRATLLTGK